MIVGCCCKNNKNHHDLVSWHGSWSSWWRSCLKTWGEWQITQFFARSSSEKRKMILIIRKKLLWRSIISMIAREIMLCHHHNLHDHHLTDWSRSWTWFYQFFLWQFVSGSSFPHHLLVIVSSFSFGQTRHDDLTNRGMIVHHFDCRIFHASFLLLASW